MKELTDMCELLWMCALRSYARMCLFQRQLVPIKLKLLHQIHFSPHDLDHREANMVKFHLYTICVPIMYFIYMFFHVPTRFFATFAKKNKTLNKLRKFLDGDPSHTKANHDHISIFLPWLTPPSNFFSVVIAGRITVMGFPTFNICWNLHMFGISKTIEIS